MFISIPKASKELQVSERHLRKLLRLGRIPAYKLSPRTTRVDLDELREHMRLLADNERGRGEPQL